MPNPSTILARDEQPLTDQYEAALRCYRNLHLPKAVREDALRKARSLADQLGLEQPGPHNGSSKAKLTVVPHQTLGSFLAPGPLAALSSFGPTNPKDFRLTRGQRLILLDALKYLNGALAGTGDPEITADRERLIELFQQN